MFSQIETLILGTLQTIFDQFGWWGVFAVMALENATGISPSEIILASAGWMLISAHDLHPSAILIGSLYAALGSAFGASVTYWIARLGGRPLIDRFARFLHIDPAYITHAESQFQRWGPILVLIGRVIPGVRTLVTIPAGVARMSYPLFFFATFAGTYIWCCLLIGAGYWIGYEYHLIKPYLQQYFVFLIFGGLAALAAYVLYLYRSGKLVPSKVNIYDRS